MKLENVKLQLMYFLDTLSFALTVSTIPPFILSIGGNHLILGLFGSGSVLFQLLSVPFLKTSCDLYGKKYILLLCSIATFILSLNLIFLRSYWSILMNRWLFSFVNHAQMLHKSLILDKPNKDMINQFIQTSAFIVGPVTSGYLFDKRGGVTCIYFISSTLLMINILFSMTVKYETSKEKSSFAFMDAVLRRMYNAVLNAQDAFKRCHYKQNWDLLVIKSLMIANATVLFTKFPVLLRYNYRVTSFVIGCTAGYQAILMHGSNAFVPIIKRNFFISSPNVYRVLVWTLLFLISLIGVCFGPTHDYYLIAYLPMILGRSVVDNIWLDIAVMRKNPFLITIADTVTSVTRLIVPIVVGFLALIFGPVAIKLSIILPVVAILGIVCSHRENYDMIRRISVGAMDIRRHSMAALRMRKKGMTKPKDGKKD